MNISRTERYKAWRKEHDYLFAQEYHSQMNNTIEFEDGFSVHTRIYKDCAKQFSMASENELFDSQGRVLYTWRNLDIDGEFCSLFHHQNGMHYLVFRIELYGYSMRWRVEKNCIIYRPRFIQKEAKRSGRCSFGLTLIMTLRAIFW